MPQSDVIVAIATAPGKGAIGVVRVSGPNLAEVGRAICGKVLPPRAATLAGFLDEDGRVIDQGLALFFPAPHSYTAEDVLELQAHGGPVVLQRLLKRCLALGARLAQPGEFSKRAFLNGKLDLAQAEAVADLIDAATEQAARCAARALQGEFSAVVHAIASRMLELRALTEATLDFPEEEIDAGTREDQTRRLCALQNDLAKLLAGANQGSLLREGAVVVLAGQPNAGKSSLLNRLAGEEIAIVTEVPGTTRDAIRQSISVAGVPVHVVDTAGLRDSHDPVEQLGIARTWKLIHEADLALLVIDATKGEDAGDGVIAARLPQGLRCLRVFNKADIASLQPGVAAGGGAVTLSAKTGAGVDLLRDAIARAIGWGGTHEGVFMAHARHLHALRMAQKALTDAAVQNARQELLAEELRRAHQALMTITGEVTADDVLGEIFGRFCIGK